MVERREIAVEGIVQGVGFRPFIYSLAQRHGLSGWVRNDLDGVRIEVEGATQDLDHFLNQIVEEAPALALVESVSWRPCLLASLHSVSVSDAPLFRIEASAETDREIGSEPRQRQALISPDVAVCADCLREMFDPTNRRYRYPFINCTNCGPRFTIVRDLPYDRALTTMAEFAMCPDCQREYEEPKDRRFHAQPNACAVCGPQVRFVGAGEPQSVGGAAIRRAVKRLLDGAIIAVKGLGGYHLACNPFHAQAVEALRDRKARQDKPFALMALDVEQARTLCRIDPEEERLLTSPARPIVLLERLKSNSWNSDSNQYSNEREIMEAVAPRQTRLGVMLAYTPLHYLLLRDAGIPLVMTSGNRSDEPISYRDAEAFAQLGGIADAFLTNDRPIHVRCDDSVMEVMGGPKRGAPVFRRRSRGYAPAPLPVAERFERPVLACGGELKNTFCVAKGRHAFLSPHIGDLENYETLCAYREGIEHYCRLFDVQPDVIAYDLHPQYLSTQYAREREEAGERVVGVQHHEAHIASCLVDNLRPDTEVVIGVALDGTGYGTDGTLWGGEFFAGSLAEGFVRRAHLETMPLPGGEAAIRHPWRMGLAQLIRLCGEEATLRLPLPIVRTAGERNVRLLARLLDNHLNTPLTSSAGRLFDAVAAIVGLPGTQLRTYEGQAAIELELAAQTTDLKQAMHAYPFRLRTEGQIGVIETNEILACVVDEVQRGVPVGQIAARFHRTVAEMLVAGCETIRETPSSSPASFSSIVALSGGTFQNRLLLELAEKMLTERGFTVYRHRRVPTNDGGLCLGQAILADRALRRAN